MLLPGIDPNNLKYDFGRDWVTFQSSRSKTFLVALLTFQLYKLHINLQTVAQEKLPDVQGEIRAVKSMLTVLGEQNVESRLKEVTDNLDKITQKPYG